MTDLYYGACSRCGNEVNGMPKQVEIRNRNGSLINAVTRVRLCLSCTLELGEVHRPCRECGEEITESAAEINPTRKQRYSYLYLYCSACRPNPSDLTARLDGMHRP